MNGQKDLLFFTLKNLTYLIVFIILLTLLYPYLLGDYNNSKDENKKNDNEKMGINTDMKVNKIKKEIGSTSKDILICIYLAQ